MRLPAALLALAALAPAAPGAEADARTAVDAGLKFLGQDALAWKADRKCASCHHAPAVRAARAFLVKTQDEDGSWEMASQPGGPGGKPAKDLGPITHAGTA